MNNSDLLKLKTQINRLKLFSCPDFNGVYSHQYFQKIIKPAISNYSDTYSIIFGDFNKLSIINEFYGEELGDKTLKFSMKLIQQSLPKNAMIIRAGGDEFYFVIPNCKKEKATEYCKLINSNLSKNSTCVCGATIELAAVDSTMSNNVDELIDIADKNVIRAKNSKKKGDSPANLLDDDFLPLAAPSFVSEEEKAKWNDLNSQINICVYNFLQNFRPSKTFSFEIEQLLDTSDFIVSAFITSLSKNAKRKRLNNSNDVIINSEKSEEKMKNLNFKNSEKESNDSNDPIASKLINELVVNDIDLNKINLTKDECDKLFNLINNVLNDLVKDKSGLFSKPYFNLYLARELSNPKNPLSASYISTSGIKLSNLTIGHSDTDKGLSVNNRIILDSLKKENINYNNTPFSTSSDDTYVISQGAGNYLFLYPTSIASKMQPKIQKIANSINNYQSLDGSQSILKVSCYSPNISDCYSSDSKITLSDYVKKIKEITDLKKNQLKKRLFKSNDAYVAFCKSIDDPINYFLNNISNSDVDIEKQKIFIKNIHTAFLNQVVMHNKSNNVINNVSINNDDEFLR